MQTQPTNSAPGTTNRSKIATRINASVFPKKIASWAFGGLASRASQLMMARAKSRLDGRTDSRSVHGPGAYAAQHADSHQHDQPGRAPGTHRDAPRRSGGQARRAPTIQVAGDSRQGQRGICLRLGGASLTTMPQ